MKNNHSEIVTLKDAAWLYRQKRAGRCVGHILKECEKLILSQQPNLSLKDFEKIALAQMSVHDCTPTFFNYKGFPSAICVSVNQQMVHGIVTDYVLQPGDIITVDLGATFEGAIADAARTWIYGEPKSTEHVRMLDVCHTALKNAIKSVQIGNRIGCIGNSIHKTVKDSGFGLVTQYGGHGIDYNEPHSNPFIANKADKNEGIRIVNGLTIAIEPIVTLGLDTGTFVASDGWTVMGRNLSCHFEDTIFVSDDGIHIITEYV